MKIFHLCPIDRDFIIFFGKIVLFLAAKVAHQFLVAAFDIRLLVLLVVSSPAVGDEVADDGWIVGDLGAGPSHHQGCFI